MPLAIPRRMRTSEENKWSHMFRGNILKPDALLAVYRARVSTRGFPPFPRIPSLARLTFARLGGGKGQTSVSPFLAALAFQCCF